MRTRSLLFVLLASCAVAAKRPVTLANRAAPAEIIADASLQTLRQRTSCEIGTISFRDPHHGLLTDTCGGAYESVDFGETWRKIDLLVHDMSPGLAFDAVIWSTPQDGVALAVRQPFALDPHTYRTADGGARWTPTPFEDWRATRDSAQPSLEAHRARVDDTRVIEWEPYGRLVFVDHDARRASPPIIRAGQPAREVIVASRAFWLDKAYGLSSTHAYHSWDGGAHWYNVGDLPAAPTRVGFVDESEIIIESALGLMVSTTAGRSWAPSADPKSDQNALEQAVSRKGGAPIACVATSARGYLHVRTTIGSRFRRRQRLDLEWSPTRSTLNAETITLVRAHELAKKLADAAVLTDHQSQVIDDGGWVSAELWWSCDGSAEQVAGLTAYGGVNPGIPRDPRHYHRAAGIAATAIQIGSVEDESLEGTVLSQGH